MQSDFSFSSIGILCYSGSIPKNMSHAIDLSIEKWKAIIEYIESNFTPGQFIPDDSGPQTCGLCMLYISDGCKDCPVARYSKDDHCHNTPYEDWVDLRCWSMVKKSDLLDAAKQELEFLQQVKYDYNL